MKITSEPINLCYEKYHKSSICFSTSFLFASLGRGRQSREPALPKKPGMRVSTTEKSMNLQAG